MTRTMFDAVTASNLPTNGWGYLFYVDGVYANGAAVKARTPGKAHIPCTIGKTAAVRGMVLDCEPGDATNAGALAWCHAYPGDNSDLTIYTGQDNWPALRKVLLALVIKPNILLANYDNVATIPTDSVFNIVGKQFRGDVKPGYDESVVKDYWPGVDPAPAVAGPQMFRGVKLDGSTVTKLLLAEELTGFPLSFPQGSYNAGGVAASAGTHDGGGAVDVHCNTYTTANKVKLVHNLRAVGFAAWHRPLNWDGAGGSEHVHCEEIGNPNLSSGAKSQIAQWNAHENGLANHGADSEPVDVEAGRPAKITSVPGTPAASTTTGADMGVIITYPKGAGWKGDFLLANGKLTHIPSAAVESFLKSIGTPTQSYSAAKFNALYSALVG